MDTMSSLSHLRYTVSILTDSRAPTTRLTVAMISLNNNVESVYEYMQVLANHQVNLLVLPPEELRKVLVKVKDDMQTNPRLELPELPNKNIWTYYSIMRITPVVMDDLLLIILTIPLIDQSL